MIKVLIKLIEMKTNVCTKGVILNYTGLSLTKSISVTSNSFPTLFLKETYQNLTENIL